MNIVIAGTGYVGLVTAAVFADKGNNVICVDTDSDKIRMLSKGGCTIFEPELEELIISNRNRLSFTVDSAAYKSADVIFIAVGTPELPDGSADLSYVQTVIDTVISTVEHDVVVVIKSTVPIGTNKLMQAYCNSNAKCRLDIASNPEFLAQGTAVRDTLHATRIVVGTESERAREVLAELYRNFDTPILYTDRYSAEMIKYASNDFLALRISYINEIANLCEALGANIEDVTLGMGMDPRIGSSYLKAGIGYGGSCFPKDTKALHWLSKKCNRELTTVKATVEVNKRQKTILLEKARKYYKTLQGLNVAVLGLSFKPGTDDLREAPSVSNVRLMLAEGANVRVWDPVALDNFQRLVPNEIVYSDTIEDALRDADICFIFTEWDDIVMLDPSAFDLMRMPVILDGRNCYKLDTMSRYPLVYESIGRPAAGARILDK